MRLKIALILGCLAAPASAATYSIGVNWASCQNCTPVVAQQANPFVQMIGVNTHLSYCCGYANITTVLNSLAYLGVKNIRDTALNPTIEPFLSAYESVAAAGGKFIAQVGTGFICTTAACVPNIMAPTFSNTDSFLAANPGAVNAVEGPNEINNSVVQFTGTFTATGSSGTTINTSTPAGLLAVNTVNQTGMSPNQMFAHLTVTDLTTPSAIPSNTKMVSATNTTVVLSNSVTVANGDVIQYQGDGNYSAPVDAVLWQQSVWNYTTSDSNLTGLPILNFTNVNQFSAPGTFTVNNGHFYPAYGLQMQCPECASGFVTQMNVVTSSPSDPFWITEYGWLTCSNGSFSCVDTTSVGPMTLNDLLDFYFLSQTSQSHYGVTYNSPAVVYLYELLDESSPCAAGVTGPCPSDLGGWGLFYANGAPKANATGIKNIISILSDPGPAFTPGSLSFATSGLNPNNGSTAYGSSIHLMEKRNGVFEIIVENEQLTYVWQSSSHVACTNYPITVTLATAASTINVYDPIIQATPINTYSGVSSVVVNSCTDPLIVEVIP